MALAIFGISNNGLNLVVTLFVLMIVVVWLALIVYTYLDAKRRISDPFLVACATIGSFFPYIGTAVYAIVRPPEFLEDAHERELEIRAAELRVRQLTEAPAPTANTRSRRATCAARSASAASRTPARAAASRSTHAGPSVPTAKPDCGSRAASRPQGRGPPRATSEREPAARARSAPSAQPRPRSAESGAETPLRGASQRGARARGR